MSEELNPKGGVDIALEDQKPKVVLDQANDITTPDSNAAVVLDQANDIAVPDSNVATLHEVHDVGDKVENSIPAAQVDSTALHTNNQNGAQDQHLEAGQSICHEESTIFGGGSTPSTFNSNDRVNATPYYYNIQPGAYAVRGPRYGAAEEEAAEEEEPIFEGFLPEPSREEILRREAQAMLDSAITLDESNVRVVPMSKDDDVTEGRVERDVGVIATPDNDIVRDDEDCAHEMEVEEEGGLKRLVKSHKAFIVLTSLLLSSIALGVAIGSNDATVSSTDETCVVGNFQERYDRARSIVSNITSNDTLANATSPQNRALEWLVCHDRISSSLIDRAAGSSSFTGSGLSPLPTQAHGSVVGGDSGESQVLRRYALAVFFYSTSESGPWTEQWNFLSGEKHECAWHTNKTRANFGYGDIDPAGFVCRYKVSFVDPMAIIILNDEEEEIRWMDLNFRIPNNLIGTIPPELGHIQGMTNVNLQYQKGLYGPIPSTIGNLAGLQTITVSFAGPEFGGVIPSSLFTIPTVEWITFQFNEGGFSFPPFINSQGSHSLLGINILSSGLSGTIPSFVSEFPNMMTLSLEDSSLEGTIPDSFGALTSLNFFNLRDNSLSGTLPESLGRLSELTAIVLGKNKLTGRLPSSVGNMTKLRLLDLSYNDFTGEIPPAFSELQSLEHISLQHNADLRGPISAFESLGNMSSLLLYGNHFSSTIPEGLFSNFTGQIFADFGHNNFTGALPETFTQWASDTSYLAIMANNFDEGVVNDVICEEVPTLFADCDSCPCCKTCCDKDSTSGNKGLCHFDLDFYILTGLECSAWWVACGDVHYDPLPTD